MKTNRPATPAPAAARRTTLAAISTLATLFALSLTLASCSKSGGEGGEPPGPDLGIINSFGSELLKVYATYSLSNEVVFENLFTGEDITIPKWDLDGDGKLSAAEAGAVKYIAMEQWGNNYELQLPANTSANTLSGLEYFKELTYLDCVYGGYLTSLDISKNPELIWLDCSANEIASLDITKNLKLTHLDCGVNALTSLDVRQNKALTWLDCSSCLLTTLDVSQNKALTYLHCGGNRLTALDISQHTALRDLDCGMNRMTALNATTMASPGDYELYCGAQTDAADNDRTLTLTLTDEQTARWAEMPYNRGANTNVTLGPVVLFDVCDLIPDLTLRAHVKSRTDWDLNSNGALSRSEAALVTEMNFNGGHGNPAVKVQSAEGLEYFTGLTALNCTGNALTSLELSANTQLTTLNCYNNVLTSIDVSANALLSNFKCNNNSLQTLDVSQNPALVYLHCHGNALTALDLSANTLLEELRCEKNSLGALELSENTALKILYCQHNPFPTLDIAQNTVLTTIFCGNGSASPLSVTITPLRILSSSIWLYAFDTGDTNEMITSAGASGARNGVTVSQAEMGTVINGVKWAECNVGAPGTFAALPTDKGMLYQWNRGTGWSTTETLTSSPAGQAWNATYDTGDTWAQANDPCPTGWRLPTTAELTKLRTGGNVTRQWESTPVPGNRLTDYDSNSSIFLPTAGWRFMSNSELDGSSTRGYYWSSTKDSSDSSYAGAVSFAGNTIMSISIHRGNALPIRCVAKE